ncbi:hypothetical protein PM082_021433 [Marasmius tenuissimus]|nr:hypothetical protein PM082_021433 [Marasmius tenuissimus]
MSDALPPATLCPGYIQVQDFGQDDEYEDEEICYVTVELENVEPTLIASSEHMRLIGLDTPTPFMQLSGTILKGQHDTLIGSELLFMESKEDQNRSKRHLAYVGTTSQRLRFKEVQLRPKQASHSQGSPDGQAGSGGKQTDSNSMEIDDLGPEKAEPTITAGKKRRGRRPKGEREKETDKDYPERPGGKGWKNKKKVAHTEEGEEDELVEAGGEPRRSTRTNGRRNPVADDSHDHQAEAVDGEA